MCCASWSISQLFLFIWSPDAEDSSDSVLGPLFSLTYILPLGDLIQSQSFEQLYIGYYFSVSPLPRAPSAYLTTSTWRIKEVSQAYVHIVTLGLCLPTKSHPPKAFTICPVVLEKHQGGSLDSCFSFPLHIQVLLISSPKTSGPVLCLHVCCKNLASIPIISCLHYHSCLPLFPLPIHFPRCSLNDLFKPPLVYITPLLKTLQRDGTSIPDKDGVTGTGFIIPYDITKIGCEIYKTMIFKTLDIGQWRRMMTKRHETK